ncbi:hypothetical protein FC07_GL002265 [Loigolactobacillus bifermentans DSM 20003]|uniref:Uncharacterized protein n=1 Tax=Loigolactobacillus bifermentans DSM 20003 TaxID=1423726 RepID=A0A0R1H797_9LACO|nr:hypothetical protein FC07_GL002265 [Loigolactobacillus bifermentans DSM 20003]
MIFLNNDQEIVQVKLDQPKNYQAATASKAFQMKLGENCQRRCENVVFCRLKNAVFYR